MIIFSCGVGDARDKSLACFVWFDNVRTFYNFIFRIGFYSDLFLKPIFRT